jgi:hypothetical protein
VNVREFVQSLQGQNPESTLLILTGDQFYELDHVATPVADATVLVVNAEVTMHPAASSAQDAMQAANPQEANDEAQENAAQTQFQDATENPTVAVPPNDAGSQA